jgi:hypothetical protein
MSSPTDPFIKLIYLMILLKLFDFNKNVMKKFFLEMLVDIQVVETPSLYRSRNFIVLQKSIARHHPHPVQI